MARLWNSARAFEGGYSLEKLSRELCGDVAPKVSMADRFSYQKMKKDGTLSKITAIDSPPELQRNPAHRTDWVLYSAGMYSLSLASLFTRIYVIDAVLSPYMSSTPSTGIHIVICLSILFLSCH